MRSRTEPVRDASGPFGGGTGWAGRTPGAQPCEERHHLLVWLAGQLLHSPTLRACVPSVVGPAERAAYAGQLRKEVSEAPHPHVVAELAASLDARDPGRPAPSLPYTGDAPDARDLILALTTARAAVEAADGAVVLPAAGHVREFHPCVRPALEALMSGARPTLGDLAEPLRPHRRTGRGPRHGAGIQGRGRRLPPAPQSKPVQMSPDRAADPYGRSARRAPGRPARQRHHCK